MDFTIAENIKALSVFIEGILSFFTPSVLPLVPILLSYLAGGQKGTNGELKYPRIKLLINTIFFIIGISFTFILLGYGATKLGHLINTYGNIFIIISGIVMIFFGLYEFGIFGHHKNLEQEKRIHYNLGKFTTGPIPALILGFTFSFAWSPYIGPSLASVLLMAGTSGEMSSGFLLIIIYTLGFIIPFLILSFFTGTVLNFIKKHTGYLKYAIRIMASVLILMGIITLISAAKLF